MGKDHIAQGSVLLLKSTELHLMTPRREQISPQPIPPLSEFTSVPQDSQGNGTVWLSCSKRSQDCWDVIKDNGRNSSREIMCMVHADKRALLCP